MSPRAPLAALLLMFGLAACDGVDETACDDFVRYVCSCEDQVGVSDGRQCEDLEISLSDPTEGVIESCRVQLECLESDDLDAGGTCVLYEEEREGECLNAS